MDIWAIDRDGILLCSFVQFLGFVQECVENVLTKWEYTEIDSLAMIRCLRIWNTYRSSRVSTLPLYRFSLKPLVARIQDPWAKNVILIESAGINWTCLWIDSAPASGVPRCAALTPYVFDDTSTSRARSEDMVSKSIEMIYTAILTPLGSFWKPHHHPICLMILERNNMLSKEWKD